MALGAGAGVGVGVGVAGVGALGAGAAYKHNSRDKVAFEIVDEAIEKYAKSYDARRKKQYWQMLKKTHRVREH